MKQFILFLICTLWVPIFAFSQTCVKVDSVFVTAKVRELGNRDIKFGIKQIAEDYLSEKYCLSPDGASIWVEVYYFGIPKNTLRIAGVEKTEQITQVGVRLHYNKMKYEGIGESATEVRTMLLEVQEGQMPFEKMTVSSALKKGLAEAINKLP
jgi:uncharacterized membrane protein